jgi:predicted nuclease of restriction endonuclease-like RecB superfamily
MLTSDLALSWQRGERITPRYVETRDAKYVAEAENLIAVFREHQGRTRGALEGALQEYVGVGTDYKILRGLIKLLMDRCAFEVESVVEPAAIRRALFLAARGAHPVNTLAARDDVVKQVASDLICAPDDVVGGLYADLPSKGKLIDFEEVTAVELLDRYNLAQAQALLYRCVALHLSVKSDSAASYRQLFGAIKAYRLIHAIEGSAASGYEIRLDGPISMFHRSQKYGIQMAVFLPALLTCRNWRLRAEITTKLRGSAFFELTSEQQQLRSAYLSESMGENPEHEKLLTKWARFESEWQLTRSREVVDLGAHAFIPDFVLRHPASGREVYLEVLGFWTPRSLKERLQELEASGFEDFLIAAWDELRGSREPLTRVPPHVIIFKRSLDPIVIELAINELSQTSNGEAVVEGSGEVKEEESEV